MLDLTATSETNEAFTTVGDTTRDDDKRARDFDQFYTRPSVARECLDFMHRVLAEQGEDMSSHKGLWIEPSAGTGVFLSLLPENRIGIDKDPPATPNEDLTDEERRLRAEIATADFFEWSPPADHVRPVITVGNPPFGRNGSLALRFLDRAAGMSKYVCFILPRTFEKQATQDKVNPHLELLDTMTLGDDSFTHCGRTYNVPCCFQVWRVREDLAKRPRKVRPLAHGDFIIVPRYHNEGDADFAFQRVGAQAGQVSTEGLSKSWKSHYFIKVATDEVDVRAVLASLDEVWARIRQKTAGNPSIGKGDLIEEYVRATGRPAPEPLSRAAMSTTGNYVMDFLSGTDGAA